MWPCWRRSVPGVGFFHSSFKSTYQAQSVSLSLSLSPSLCPSLPPSASFLWIIYKLPVLFQSLPATMLPALMVTDSSSETVSKLSIECFLLQVALVMASYHRSRKVSRHPYPLFPLFFSMWRWSSRCHAHCPCWTATDLIPGLLRICIEKTGDLRETM